MAIRYQIATWSSPVAMKAHEFTVRKQLPAALDELWRQCHAMLAGDGALDTARGWKLRKEFEAYAAKLESEGLGRGRYRADTFNGRDGWHVTFMQERI